MLTEEELVRLLHWYAFIFIEDGNKVEDDQLAEKLMTKLGIKQKEDELIDSAIFRSDVYRKYHKI